MHLHIVPEVNCGPTKSSIILSKIIIALSNGIIKIKFHFKRLWVIAKFDRNQRTTNFDRPPQNTRDITPYITPCFLIVHNPEFPGHRLLSRLTSFGLIYMLRFTKNK